MNPTKTKPLTGKERCLEALRGAPQGLIPTEAAKLTGMAPGSMSGELGALYYRGLADRENVGRSEALPTYRYTLNDPPKPTRERPPPTRRRPRRKNEEDAPLEPEVAAEEEVEETEEPAPQPSETTVAAAVRLPVLQTLNLNALLDSLASQIADQLVGRIVSNLERRLPQAFSGEIEPAITPQEVPVRGPKVAVVGLLGSQIVRVRRKYDGRLNLSFPLKDNKTALKQAATFNEAVLTMTKFIGHSTENTLKAGGANIIRVAGGLSELELRLESLAGEAP